MTAPAFAIVDLFDESRAPAPRAAPTHRVPVIAHTRRVKGSAPPSGRERRDAALSTHQEDEAKRTAIAYVRAQLAELYRLRAVTPKWADAPGGPWVNADDIDDILREWAECPLEIHRMTGHWKGCVFQRRHWHQTGRSEPSRRAHMNHTALPCWALRQEG